MIKHLLIFAVICTIAASDNDLPLNLPPVNINQIAKNDIIIPVTPLLDAYTAANQLITCNNNQLSVIDNDKKLYAIAEELVLAAKVGDVTMNHMSWNLHINNKLGVLRVAKLDAYISHDNIKVAIDIIEYVQPIPTPKRQGYYLGDRKYGLVGPRKKHWYEVDRDLTAEEVNRIANVLSAYIPKNLPAN